MTHSPPPEPASDDDDSIPVGRLVAWGALAVVLLVGLYLYFRFESGIIPLNDKVN